jgi:hypothetical protein
MPEKKTLERACKDKRADELALTVRGKPWLVMGDLEGVAVQVKRRVFPASP